MNIDKITIGDAQKLAEMFGQKDTKAIPETAFEIGKPYLIRTVTMIDTGIVVDVNEQEIVLEEAAWIADTGQFSEALEKAEFGEVEPFPDGKVILGRGAIIDAIQIKKTQRSLK